MKIGLYPFHNVSIQARSWSAKICACAPLLMLTAFAVLISYGIFVDPVVLLTTCAIMNITVWVWFSVTALFCIAGTIFAQGAIEDELQLSSENEFCQKSRHVSSQVDVEGVCDDRVAHLIVIPNYREDEALLTETLQSLSEADDRETFHIVLAMEARERWSSEKAQRLKERFKHAFALIVITVHPSDMTVQHLDGSIIAEVPGKASNLKWAVPMGLSACKDAGALRSVSSVLLTITDADCIFHPSYFRVLSKEFNMLREAPGAEHLWTMWQAPQLPFRNFFDSPACSRVWGYIASIFEFGGVAGLSFGCSHMVFSAYSLPLQLALNVQAWDGDVIAEDHHCFLKCFFYSAHVSATNAMENGTDFEPKLRMRPIYLPVKATSVSSQSYWQSWIDRWHQAKRHSQGVAELSYALLASYHAVCSLPWEMQTFSLYLQFFSVVFRVWCVHLLPMCQALGLGSLTALWLFHERSVPMCPTEIWWADLTTMEYLLCGFAGAWVLVWPVVIPFLLVIVANCLFLNLIFLRPRDKHLSSAKWTIWHAIDGGVPGNYGTQRFFAILMVLCDCIFSLSLIMIPYGFVAEIVAYFEVAFFGNNVEYKTAPKRTVGPTAYGTIYAPCERPLGQISDATKKIRRGRLSAIEA